LRGSLSAIWQNVAGEKIVMEMTASSPAEAVRAVRKKMPRES
jgi:hypothetical protein